MRSFANLFPQKCGVRVVFKNLKWHKKLSGSSFKKSQKDLSNDSLCDPPPPSRGQG